MNIAEKIDRHVERAPDKQALFYPLGDTDAYESLTLRELSEKASQVASSLHALGVRKGSKVLLFVRPSLDFPVIAYALFKLGAVSILIDPGMGRKNLFNCIEEVTPDVLIAVPEVFIGRRLFPKVFSSVKTMILCEGPSAFKSWLARVINPGVIKLRDLLSRGEEAFDTTKVSPGELAAIVFTSGGTGRPKGVEYSHGIYCYQVDVLQKTYGLSENDIDLPAFPLFALFSLAMGMSVVIPDMDPTKPAKACPKRLVSHIKRKSVTFAGGSPAIWERVAEYCVAENIELPSLKSLMMFGAPVASKIHKDFVGVLVRGTTYTPYGATECLPVSTISGKEILESRLWEKTDEGKGTCVGYSSLGTEIKIIEQTEDAVESLEDVTELKALEIGEIIVKGRQVTKQYYLNPEKTRFAKIYDGEDVWHRMGDLGYLDMNGRLWFCGRMVHAIKVDEQRLCSVTTEAHFNVHPLVKRSALIDYGPQNNTKPGLVIEKKPGASGAQIRKDLLEISKTQKLDHLITEFFSDDHFPVDVRHNIKIDRKKLGEMAKNGRLKTL